MTWSRSAAGLLDAWEQGQGEPPARQALILLQWARGTGREGLEHLSIGRRNAALLALREQLFGPEMAALASCPKCGETLDLAFQMDDIAAGPSATEAASESADDNEPAGWAGEAAHDGYRVHYRLPDTADLLAVGAAHAAGSAFRQALLARCVDAPLDSLPEPLLEQIVASMVEADPQADVRLSLTCPACSHAWQAPFDIVTFLWREVDDWAARTLREVHALATAYGWAEDEILALSAPRRQLYLDMIGG